MGKGRYESISPVAKQMFEGQWLPLKQLQQWMNSLNYFKGRYFFYVGSLKGVMTASKFSIQPGRFPEKLVVSIDDGILGKEIMRFCDAVFALPDENKQRDAYMAAESDILASLQRMKTILLCSDPETLSENGIFDRASFEKKFSLKWID